MLHNFIVITAAGTHHFGIIGDLDDGIIANITQRCVYIAKSTDFLVEFGGPGEAIEEEHGFAKVYPDELLAEAPMPSWDLPRPAWPLFPNHPNCRCQTKLGKPDQQPGSYG